MTTLITASIIAFGIFGFRLLPVSALPRVDLPDHRRHRDVAGRERGHHGGIGRRRHRAPALDHCRHLVDVVELFAGHQRDHHPVRSQPQHRCRGARRADSADHCAAPVADRDEDPAEFPQGEPGRFRRCCSWSLGSSTLPLSAVNEYGDITIGQTLSQIPGVAQVSVYGAQKFAIRVQADPEAAAARGLSLEDIRNAVSARQFLDAGRHPERTEAGRRIAGLRPDGQGDGLSPHRGGLAQRLPGQAR